ncbi:hypothetical protein [Burkholderia singularis]|uniref:hypothetical protein n=1 Tax=Burkholderia singularis TaxID=1503053 RepID=UPI000A92F237|nr:hypothetical protein [Burkholderia singularis]
MKSFPSLPVGALICAVLAPSPVFNLENNADEGRWRARQYLALLVAAMHKGDAKNQ